MQFSHPGCEISLVKLPLGGQFEPSHCAVDLASGMVREQALRYILPGSRAAEVGSVRKDEHLVRLDLPRPASVKRPW